MGSRPAGEGDFRSHLPRFSEENFKRNAKVIEALKELAADKGIQPAQLAVAWVLAKGQRIVPVIGARTRKQLSESLAAL
jgi:aryl-alcohol dehydrogenase-like predicted oxidoreductase